jgi:hypothetical protein
MKKKFHKEWNFFIFILPLLGATSLQLHFNLLASQMASYERLYETAMQAGLSPCERDCPHRTYCKEGQACLPFYNWVHYGARTFPSKEHPPDRKTHLRLFPKDRTADDK